MGVHTVATRLPHLLTPLHDQIERLANPQTLIRSLREKFKTLQERYPHCEDVITDNTVMNRVREGVRKRRKAPNLRIPRDPPRILSTSEEEECIDTRWAKLYTAAEKQLRSAVSAIASDPKLLFPPDCT